MRGWSFVAALFAFVVALSAVRPAPALTQATHNDHLSQRVQRATGLYISGPFVRLHGVEGIVAMLRRARMDTAVVDFKDGMGRVLFDSAIPELAGSESRHIEDPRALVQALHDANIHVIGRVVCFSDRQLAVREPDRAIQDNRPRRRGQPWISWGTGGAWLNPWDRRNLDMIVRLVDEVEAFGVDEIQLDYIRFPVDDGVHLAAYPGERTDVTRAQHLHELLARIDATISVPLGADVFGIQAFWEGDRSGLGQDLALWADHIDVFFNGCSNNRIDSAAQSCVDHLKAFVAQSARQHLCATIMAVEARLGDEYANRRGALSHGDPRVAPRRDRARAPAPRARRRRCGVSRAWPLSSSLRPVDVRRAPQGRGVRRSPARQRRLARARRSVHRRPAQ
jgi:hypothetical protein